MSEHELTARQQASMAEKKARAELSEIHKQERRELEDCLSEFRANIQRDRTENYELTMQAEIEAAVRLAVKRAGSGDVMMQYRSTIEGMLGQKTLAKMRQEAGAGELPMLVVACAPVAGEKAPKAPVLLILDISERLGWQEI